MTISNDATATSSTRLALDPLGGLLGGLLDQVDTILDGLLGGGGSAPGAGTGSGSGGDSESGGIAIGNLINTRLLDGLINLQLLNDETVLKLELLGYQGDENGLLSLSLLDPDSDGLIDLSLLNDGISVSALDPDGDGLVDIDILDLIDVGAGPAPSDDIDGGTGPQPGNPGSGGSTEQGSYQQVVIGSLGPDNIFVGDKTTFVDGLAGVDVVSYGVQSDGFTYKTTENGVFIIENGSKVDYLQDVERVKFADGTLVLDTDIGENAGMAYRIYQAAFDRMPDVSGLKFWLGELDGGVSFYDVANGFLFSDEFKQTYGTDLSNEQFVTKLYQNILDRAPDQGGYDFWTSELNDGAKDWAQVLASFAESPENVALLAPVIDDGFFLA